MTYKNVIDWEDLTPEDQRKAEELMHELNNLFKKYDPKEENCEDSTSTD
jgi:hypothetical protein